MIIDRELEKTDFLSGLGGISESISYVEEPKIEPFIPESYPILVPEEEPKKESCRSCRTGSTGGTVGGSTGGTVGGSYVDHSIDRIENFKTSHSFEKVQEPNEVQKRGSLIPMIILTVIGFIYNA